MLLITDGHSQQVNWGVLHWWGKSPKIAKVVTIYDIWYVVLQYMICNILIYALSVFTNRNMYFYTRCRRLTKRDNNREKKKLVAHRLLQYILCNIIYFIYCAIYSMKHIQIFSLPVLTKKGGIYTILRSLQTYNKRGQQQQREEHFNYCHVKSCYRS